jgi:hypothetical protein
MTECVVETCRRPGVVCIDRNDPPQWVLCRTCYMCIVAGSGPYTIKPVWENRQLKRLVAIQQVALPEDDQGPVLI